MCVSDLCDSVDTMASDGVRNDQQVRSDQQHEIGAAGAGSETQVAERDTNGMINEFVEEHEFEGNAAGTWIQGMVAATTEGFPPFGVMDKEEG